MPGYRLTAWLRPLLTLAMLAGVLSLAACGGGNGSPSSSGRVATLAITPASATTYSGTPFTFLVSGGAQPYTVISSDQSALPVVGALNGNVLIVVPGSVGGDTTVTLSVRDASGQATSAAVTIRPALLLPASITITGNPNCGGSGATLCSGQDGTASVHVTGPAGAPLAGRSVRFDVIQGSYSISSTAPGQPLVSTLTVNSDQNGNAAVRLVVPPTAATQFATIQATDVAGGSSVIGQFTISQFVNGSPVLSAIPSGTTTFTGPNTTQCSTGASATFYIFGGTPPYTVATNFPQTISISGSPVARSGGGFTITTNGLCFTNLTFAITDAAGRVLIGPPTVTNAFGTTPATTPPTALQVTPGQNDGTSIAPVSCTGTFGFTISGKAPFSAVASDPNVNLSNGGTVAASPGSLTASNFTAGSIVTLTIGDGSTPQQIDTETIFCK